MKVELELEDLLNLITYDKTLDGVSLVNYPNIAKAIESLGHSSTIAMIEWATPEHPILWSTQGYVNECKRKAELDSLAERHKKNYVPKKETIQATKIKTDRPQRTEQELKQMIAQAESENNMMKAAGLRMILALRK